ncbi:TraB/GumN family protein [Dyella ginsengisoli]|uniref:TraB/GumN family protein n=1 Tax=Dyella ginsengisoli TaxID=363848 RepID=UPI000348E8F0|nr:TraB/GumN family protein [Dyella ginsengisoli]
MHASKESVRRRLRLALGLCALLCSGAALADPALWLVKGPHASLYLYGTVHVLRPNQPWETPALDKALAASQDLWLEVPDADNAAKMQPLIRTLGMDPAHPLSSKLDKADVARVDAAARSAGIPVGEQALEPMQPWLASLSLATLPLMQAGYDPKSGVEIRLKARSQAMGKPVRGLETLTQQLHFFADMPQTTQVAMLRATLAEVDAGPKRLDALVTAWEAGDLDGIARITAQEMASQTPTLYENLIVRRNRQWATQLDERLRGAGTSFVAVGTAHLVGPDSVQTLLARRGYTIERVQ